MPVVANGGDSATGKRSSSRLEKMRSERGGDICYNEEAKRKAEMELKRKAEMEAEKKKGKVKVKAKTKVGCKRKLGRVADEIAVAEEDEMGEELVVGEGIVGRELRSLGLQVEIVANGGGVGVGKSAHLRVKETLRQFNKHYLHFIQEEELRVNGLQKIGKQNKTGDQKKVPHKRPDLKATSKMMETSAILYPVKQFGQIPGVDVGHQFFSRAEMVAVGFHSHWLNGIDYMGHSYCKGDYAEYTFPIAISVVMSGQYEDDVDNSEDVVYTGQGGNNLLGDKHQNGDQQMLRGNLALKNSMECGLPVRVTRGHSCKTSYVGKVYTYDGLYKVVKYWAEKGISGFTVYKYRMVRLPGQPELTTNQVQYTRGQIPNSVSEVRGLVCKDISEGQEDIPIPATNLVDEESFPPAGYTYIRSIQVAANVKIPRHTIGCGCKGGCVDPKICACAKLNGGDFPYVLRNGGRLIEAKAIVFECGPKCGCGPECVNRISQKGIRYRLEVFRTPKKGWGVRSWDIIPAGAFICEYTGILKKSDEAESVAESNYIFDIDCLQTMKGLDGRERRFKDVSMPSLNFDRDDEKITESAPEFCIDAGSTGNIARFFNHSCEPNLFVQCILSSHHDIKLAKVMLFAADSIPPLQELTYDYGYALDSVTGPDGKIKKLTCYCGAPGCRKRLF